MSTFVKIALSLFALISKLNPLLKVPKAFYEALPIPKFRGIVSFRYRMTRSSIGSFQTAASVHNRKINRTQVMLYLREILEGRWSWSQSAIKVCCLSDWLSPNADPEERAHAQYAVAQFQENNPDELVPEFWVVDGQHRLDAISRALNDYEGTDHVDVQLTVNVAPSTFLKETSYKRTTVSHLQATGKADLAIIRPIRVAAIGGCKASHVRRVSEEAEALALTKFAREARAFQSYSGTKMFAENCNCSTSFKAIGLLLYVQPKACWDALRRYAAPYGYESIFLRNIPSPDSLIPNWERMSRAIAARYRANNTTQNDSVSLKKAADKAQGPAGGAAGQYAAVITNPFLYGFGSSSGSAGKQFTYRLAEVTFAWWCLGRKIPQGKVLRRLTNADNYQGILPTLPGPEEV